MNYWHRITGLFAWPCRKRRNISASNKKSPRCGLCYLWGSELVDHTDANDVIGCNTVVTVEGIIFVQQVDFIINVGGEVLVEAVGHAHVDVVNQILVYIVITIAWMIIVTTQRRK